MSIGTLPLSRFTVLDLDTIAPRPRTDPRCANSPLGRQGHDDRPPAAPPTTSQLSAREGFDFKSHREQRSLALNLKNTDGKAIFLKDFAQEGRCDRRVQAAEVKFRLGVDTRSSRSRAHRLWQHLPLGQTRPYAKRPQVDQIARGWAG